MTKAAAIHKFWSSFGLEAYEENSVPSGERAPDFPYLTYQFISDDFWGGSVLTTASLWYRSSSNVAINAKAEEISAYIGRLERLECDDGTIFVKQGHPFSQPGAGDPSDEYIKRKILNVLVEYITNN